MFNTVEDISAMLRIEEFDLSPDTIEFWKDKGKFKKVIATELGANILKNLSLKIRLGLHSMVLKRLLMLIWLILVSL